MDSGGNGPFKWGQILTVQVVEKAAGPLLRENSPKYSQDLEHYLHMDQVSFIQLIDDNDQVIWEKTSPLMPEEFLIPAISQKKDSIEPQQVTLASKNSRNKYVYSDSSNGMNQQGKFEVRKVHTYRVKE